MSTGRKEQKLRYQRAVTRGIKLRCLQRNGPTDVVAGMLEVDPSSEIRAAYLGHEDELERVARACVRWLIPTDPWGEPHDVVDFATKFTEQLKPETCEAIAVELTDLLGEEHLSLRGDLFIWLAFQTKIYRGYLERLREQNSRRRQSLQTGVGDE